MWVFACSLISPLAYARSKKDKWEDRKTIIRQNYDLTVFFLLTRNAVKNTAG